MSQKVTLNLGDETVKEIARIALREGTNRSIVIRQLITQALSTRKTAKKEQTNVS